MRSLYLFVRTSSSGTRRVRYGFRLKDVFSPLAAHLLLLGHKLHFSRDVGNFDCFRPLHKVPPSLPFPSQLLERCAVQIAKPGRGVESFTCCLDSTTLRGLVGARAVVVVHRTNVRFSVQRVMATVAMVLQHRTTAFTISCAGVASVASVGSIPVSSPSDLYLICTFSWCQVGVGVEKTRAS